MNQYEWDFSKYYGSNQGCYQEINNIEKRLDEYNVYKDHLLDSAQNLYDGLQLDLEVHQEIDNLKFYIDRKYDVDITDSEVKKLKDEISTLENKKIDKADFIHKELSKLSLEDISEYIIENPKLESLRLYLERIIKNNHHMVDVQDKKLEKELIYFLELFVRNANLLRNKQIDFGSIEFEGNTIEISNHNYKNI